MEEHNTYRPKYRYNVYTQDGKLLLENKTRREIMMEYPGNMGFVDIYRRVKHGYCCEGLYPTIYPATFEEWHDEVFRASFFVDKMYATPTERTDASKFIQRYGFQNYKEWRTLNHKYGGKKNV